jgi:lipid II:glycine glycyltransferase (peptidoglycan interpeptide bridge formation enzyme)
MTELRQAEEYGQFMASLGWLVEKGMFIKPLPLIPFSFIKLQRCAWPLDFKQVEAVAKKYRAIQVKIEPNLTNTKNWEKIKEQFQTWGYKETNSPLLPTKTIWLDLNQSDSKLLAGMKPKTRYNLKLLKTKSLQLKIFRGDQANEKTLKDFYQLYQENARRQKFWGLNFNQLNSLLQSFKQKAWLLLVSQETCLGGLILLIHHQVAYYSHNAASQQGKKLLVPTMLVWQAIRLAKNLGCKRFDFEGISDERFSITKSWQGFTRFKQGFGGKEVKFIGCFSKVGH